MCQRLSDEHEQNQQTCRLSAEVIAKTPSLSLVSGWFCVPGLAKVLWFCVTLAVLA